MDLDYEAILRTFLSDAEEHLSEMEEAALRLEAGGSHSGDLADLFRRAHSLKGDAACVNVQSVAELSHVLEDLLEELREGRVEGGPSVWSLVLEAVDALRTAVGRANGGATVTTPEELEMRDRLAEAVGGELAATLPAARSVGWADQESRSAIRQETLRVDMDKLDRLLNLTGEIAIERGRVRQLLEAAADDAGAADALEAHMDFDRLYLALQELVLRIRMVPLGPTFRQHVRTVRDLARGREKLARLVVEGAEVEVDTAIVQQVRDALTHLVRNAVDHGIEAPQVRVAAGKDPVGQVTLSARHQSGHIVIEVTDDGAGLDRQRIVARAVAEGLVAPDADPQEVELAPLIFRPAFSTALRVTEISGRGVGMDVVRRSAESLRGTVSVSTRQGEGTTVALRLPLTLLIIEGFAVEVGGDVYVLPLESVEECLDLPRFGIGAAHRGPYGHLDVRGGVLPFVRLRPFFGHPDVPVEHESIVVIQDQGQRAGLVVDRLLGEHQTVIKPLDILFQNARGISASTVLGDGRVGLIVDVGQILETVHEASRAALAS